MGFDALQGYIFGPPKPRKLLNQPFYHLLSAIYSLY